MRKLLNIFAVLTLLLIELAVAIPIQLSISNESVSAAAVYSNLGGTITTNGSNTVHTFNYSEGFYACSTGTVKIEAWGGGGGGGIIASSGGGGGGGGAYASNATVSVVAGTTYYVVPGIGGVADTAAGGSSYVMYLNLSYIVLAVGGAGTTGATAAAGGLASACIGVTKYNGGGGGTGLTTDDTGAGGGGAGGPDGAGVTGANAGSSLGGNGGRGDNSLGGLGGTNVSANNGNPGGASTLGGGGGAGGDNGCYGGVGGWPGGGGGGGEVAGGETGASGAVIITCVTASFQAEASPSYTVDSVTASSGIWTVPTNVSSIDVFVVAGGGGGGTYGGGGGGGAVLYLNKSVYPGQRFSYTVGTGGAGGSTGVNGINSSFGLMVAVGGGFGQTSAGNGGNGGNGGGCYASALGGVTTQPNPSGGGVGIGYNASNGNGAGYSSGGSGAGGPSPYPTAATSVGGAGYSLWWSGSLVWYAAGGGGSTSGAGPGGPGYNASANTGCGGNSSGSGAGFSGYSGVIVVRYLSSPTCTAPNPPDNINLIPWSNSFLVTWNKGSGAYYTRFVRKAGSLPSNFSDGTLAYLGTDTSFYDTTLTPGVTYYYLAQSEAVIGGWPAPGAAWCNSSTNASSSAQCLAMPTVVTSAVTDIGVQSAVLNGEVTSLGGTTITSWGFYWDTAPNSSSEYTTGTGSLGVGDFDLTFNSTDGGGTPLVGGTTYYVRAFASCSNGTSWGEETSFTALDPTEGDTLITLHDSCGVSRTHIPVQANLSVSSFISGGFLDSTGLDQEMFEGASARYSMLNTSSGWVRTVIPSLVTYGTKDYTWTTGYAPSDTLQDFIIGAEGFVSCSASTTQFPGVTYNITWQGYLNSSTAGPILEVVNSFGIGSFGNGSIWGYVNTSATNQSVSTAVASGSHTISLIGNTSYCGLYVDGVLTGSFDPGGLPVYSALGVMMDTDVALATRQAIITTDDDSVILDWGLRDILTGSTIPDYSGNNNNGSVTWGTTVNCLSITLGGAQSDTDYSPPEGGDAYEPPDMIPPIEEGDIDPGFWWGGVVDPDLPMYDLFKRAEDAGWGSVYVLYLFVMIATAVAIGLGTTLATGSIMVGTIAVGVVLFAGALAGVIAGWVTVVYGIVVGCYLLVSRSL